MVDNARSTTVPDCSCGLMIVNAKDLANNGPLILAAMDDSIEGSCWSVGVDPKG